MIEVIEYTLGRFSVHNYLVIDTETKETVLIDTGDEPHEIIETIQSRGLDFKLLLYTHAHIDHMQGHQAIREAFPDVPAWVHTEENFWIDKLAIQALTYGMMPPKKPLINGGYVEHGQIFELTNMSFESRFCPGHTPGGISYYVKEGPYVFTGDSLFAGTIGRTDFPRGDHKTLIHSIETQLLTLPEGTIVYSGHGRPTTIGEEKESNPYLVRAG